MPFFGLLWKKMCRTVVPGDLWDEVTTMTLKLLNNKHKTTSQFCQRLILLLLVTGTRHFMQWVSSVARLLGLGTVAVWLDDSLLCLDPCIVWCSEALLTNTPLYASGPPTLVIQKCLQILLNVPFNVEGGGWEKAKMPRVENHWFTEWADWFWLFLVLVLPVYILEGERILVFGRYERESLLVTLRQRQRSQVKSGADGHI